MIRSLDTVVSAVTLLVIVLLHVHSARANRKTLCFQKDDSEQSLYDFSVRDVHKDVMVNLSSYSNQVRHTNSLFSKHERFKMERFIYLFYY